MGDVQGNPLRTPDGPGQIGFGVWDFVFSIFCPFRQNRITKVLMVAENSSLPEVVLYTRAGCHLCDEAKEQIRQAKARAPFGFREVDIRSEERRVGKECRL